MAVLILRRIKDCFIDAVIRRVRVHKANNVTISISCLFDNVAFPPAEILARGSFGALLTIVLIGGSSDHIDWHSNISLGSNLRHKEWYRGHIRSLLSLLIVRLFFFLLGINLNIW